MTGLAGRGEAGLHVIRSHGALKIRHVAGRADRVRRSQVVVVIDMTRRTRRVHVRAGQRETCRRVVKACSTPIRRRMAALAGDGEAALHVVRISGALKIRYVAGGTSRIGRRQSVIVVHVAG